MTEKLTLRAFAAHVSLLGHKPKTELDGNVYCRIDDGHRLLTCVICGRDDICLECYGVRWQSECRGRTR